MPSPSRLLAVEGRGAALREILAFDGLDAALAAAVTALREHGPAEAYAALRGQVPGLGPAFFTKFLHFTGLAVPSARGPRRSLPPAATGPWGPARTRTREPMCRRRRRRTTLARRAGQPGGGHYPGRRTSRRPPREPTDPRRPNQGGRLPLRRSPAEARNSTG
ncbi:hypothetical protein [Streptomyces sp. NPDC096105]|uniref:8-oxoguanine DNA glycosylase OGG fold protein n=1 Tax=Streptomyces sp. NPDC096105 TaxID=3366074 RepID=UPI0037FBAF05